MSIDIILNYDNLNQERRRHYFFNRAINKFNGLPDDVGSFGQQRINFHGA